MIQVSHRESKLKNSKVPINSDHLRNQNYLGGVHFKRRDKTFLMLKQDFKEGNNIDKNEYLSFKSDFEVNKPVES